MGENRFCTNCGAELVEDATFCVNCGQPVEVADTNPAILLLGVMTLLLAASEAWALVQMRSLSAATRHKPL